MNKLLKKYFRFYVLFLMLFLCLVVSNTTYAQILSGPAVTCQSLNLQNISGTLLQRYFTSSGSVGGRGCWVHPHPNNTDYIITPFSWGSEPNLGKILLINSVIEGISNSRSAYSRLGGTQNMAVYYLLNDVADNATTEWPIGNNCWIEAGPHGGEGSWREPNSHLFKQQVAHEIGHCFIMENITNYTESTYTNRNAHWWDESAAEYLSTLAYPTLNGEYISARQFDLDGRDFMQPYNAFILFDDYVAQLGLSSFLPLLNELHTAMNSDSVLQVFKLNNRHRIFHNFYVNHFQSALQDPGCATTGGSCTYPREVDVQPRYETVFEESDDMSIRLPALSDGLLNVVNVSVPKGWDISIGAVEGDIPNAHLHGTLLVDNNSFNMNTSNLLPASCDADRDITMLFTHLIAPKLSPVIIPYTMNESDCEPVDIAFRVNDKYTIYDDGPGVVRLPGHVGARALRPGDQLKILNQGPETTTTILRIVKGAPSVEVSSLAAGDYGTIIVFGTVEDFTFDQKLVRPED
ncbi:MAG: hypothetical protein AB8B80_00500 [Marinicellaceae bacterium]